MYLYCYARSDKARMTGQKLIDQAEGEWIDDLESFVSVYGTSGQRADGTVVLLLYQEACVKLLLERLYPSDIKYPIINITPDGKYAGILRPGGYNTYQILAKITSILGCTALSGNSKPSPATVAGRRQLHTMPGSRPLGVRCRRTRKL